MDKVALFDLDGTLVWTLPEYRYRSVQVALKDLGKTTSRVLADRFWFGMHRNTLIETEFGVPAAEFWSAFDRYHDVAERIAHTFPFDDVTALYRLKELGYKNGILTGSPPHIARPEIELLPPGSIDFVINARDDCGSRTKPHPQGVYDCLATCGHKPENGFFVGNADEDVEAGLAASIHTILVDRKEYPYTVTPHHVISSLHELVPYLQSKTIDRR
jgi:phosphoglycolate phosphatase-like HAD superfamily hydrolase